MRQMCLPLIIVVLMNGTLYGATCPDDMSTIVGFEQTFVAAVLGSCPAAYQLMDEIPEHILIQSGGLILGTPETLCDDGEYMENNVCTPAPQGRCDDGYARLPGETVTLYKIIDDKCISGYEKTDLPSSMYNIANGFVYPTGETLCDDGYRLIGDTCVPYEGGDCPPDMFSYEPSVDTLVPITNGACATGYVVHDDNKSCGDSDSSDNFCAVLCDAGENWTYAGVCSARCTTNGIKRLHVGDLSFTTYTNKTTERALVFDNGSARCYGNMTLGRGTGTLNVNDENGLIWHLTE